MRWLVLFLAASLVVPQAPEPPVIPVRTEIVHVEAVVTDKRGRPVLDLKADDFHLYEDGKPVPIVAFEAAIGGPETPHGPEPSASPGAALPAGVAAAAAEPPTVVVYLDAPNLTPAGLRRSLDRLAQLLEAQIAAGLRVLILAERRGTRALTPPTSDPAVVRAAVEEARKLPVQGSSSVQDERGVRDLLRDLVEMAEVQGSCADVLAQMQSAVRQHAEIRRHQIDDTLARLGGLASALGTLPGSKALLFMTEGLEQLPALALFSQIGDICPQVMRRDFSQLFAAMQEADMSAGLKQAAARANAARVTIYPLDAAGLTTASASDVSHGSRRYAPTPRNDSVREANLRAGPFILAEQTGGSPVFAANAPAAALGRLSEEIRGRYSLGFTPGRDPDGRTHRLHVELRRKGLRVRHRVSYLHAEPAERQLSRTLAALLLGYEDDGLDARIRAEFGAPEQGEAAAGSAGASASTFVVSDTISGPLAGSGHADAGGSGSAETPAEIRVRLSLPLARLTTQPVEAGRRARLRIVIVLRAAGESMEDARPHAREKEIELSLPPAPPGGDDPNARRDIVVRIPAAAGPREVAVGVSDVLGGESSYKRVEVGG
ncbi:MAG: VWA domain-containing protein [Vicinamibacteria bacterium]